MNKFLLLVFVGLFSCNDSPYMQGKRLYTAYCANCHMDDGSGLSQMIPAIQKSKITYSSEMVCILYMGKTDTLFKGDTFLVKEMPSFKQLSSTEVANIINYVNHAFTTDFREKSIVEVESDLKKCQGPAL